MVPSHSFLCFEQTVYTSSFPKSNTKKTCQNQVGNQRLSREVVSSLSSNRLTFFIISVNDFAHFALAPPLRPLSITRTSGRHSSASEYCQWSIYFVAKDELSPSYCANSVSQAYFQHSCWRPCFVDFLTSLPVSSLLFIVFYSLFIFLYFYISFHQAALTT